MLSYDRTNGTPPELCTDQHCLAKMQKAGQEDLEESKTPTSLDKPKDQSGAEDESLTSYKG